MKFFIVILIIKLFACKKNPIILIKAEFYTHCIFANPSNDEIEMFCNDGTISNDLEYYFKFDTSDNLLESKILPRQKTYYKYYLDSEDEYIIDRSIDLSFSKFLYVINNKGYEFEKVGLEVFYMKDKSLFAYSTILGLHFYYYKNPFRKKCTFDILGEKCNLISDIKKSYYNNKFYKCKVLNLSNKLFFIAYLNKPYRVEIYRIDQNLDLKKIDTIQEVQFEIEMYDLDPLNDKYIICMSKRFNYNNYESICSITKYNIDKFIFEKSITLLENVSDLPDIILLNNNQIIALTSNYITICNIKKGDLEFGLFRQKKFEINLPENAYPELQKIIYFINKGITIFYSAHLRHSSIIFKIYIEKDYCLNFEKRGIKPYIKELINFENYISSGLDITITFIDRKIKLYQGDLQIYKNQKINLKDKVYAICEDSFDYLKIGFQYNGNDCEAHLYTEPSYINVMNNPHRCLLDPNIKKINNIIDHDIDQTYYDIETKTFTFTLKFENEIQSKDSEIYFLGGKKKCLIKSNNVLYCSIKTSNKLYKNNIRYIYSYLSCLNLIPLSKVNINDKYLLSIYKINNLKEYSKSINKKYNPKEEIKSFSVDMITYYYWFAGFAYCDDDAIKEKNCCKKEILNHWDIQKHMEYRNEKNNKYIYNFAILKSTEYNKFIFAFPGTTNKMQLLKEINGAKDKVIFDLIEEDLEKDVLIEGYFYEVFKIIYKDLFSDEIIKELKLYPNYQIIFIGHSLGGAMATLSSYYYAKNKISLNEPVLITFGQPRVGNEIFARKFTKLIPLIFRVARKGDIVTAIPTSNWRKSFEYTSFGSFLYTKNDESIHETIDFEHQLLDDNAQNKINDFILKNDYNNEKKVNYYCHIGGLYVLNDDIIYQCKDYYNEEINHPICEIKIKNGFSLNFLDNHGYLNFAEKLSSKCKES